jgi:hypothetical protein
MLSELKRSTPMKELCVIAGVALASIVLFFAADRINRTLHPAAPDEWYDGRYEWPSDQQDEAVLKLIRDLEQDDPDQGRAARRVFFPHN